MASGSVRVLIAGEIGEVVSAIEKLEPFADIEPCGMARDLPGLAGEAERLRPDVILVTGSLGGDGWLAALDTAHRASPESRPVAITPDGVGPFGDVPAVAQGVTGADLAALVRTLRPEGGPRREAATGVPPIEPERRRRAPPGRGEIFLVFAGKGGVGKSVVASNLAVAIRMDTGDRVGLVDLDLQFGDVALMLGVEHHAESIELLAHHGELLDQQVLRQVMAPGPGGVEALLAPPAPELAELVTPPALRAILREMGRAYDHIVIDGPAHLDEQTLEVIDIADHIVVVTSFSVTAVKDTRIMLTLLRTLGVERERISLVLNQTRARTTLVPEDIEDRLGFAIRTTLPFEHRIVDDAIDRGLPFVISEPAAEISRRLHSLAEFLIAPATGGAGEEASLPHPFRRRFGIGRQTAGIG